MHNRYNFKGNILSINQFVMAKSLSEKVEGKNLKQLSII